MIEKILAQLGFSSHEISVYLAAVKLDQSTATNLAKETEINRTTVYDILDTLMAKGVVSKIKKRGKSHYYALPPNKLTDYLERERSQYNKNIDAQKEKLAKIMPELVSMQNLFSKNKPKVHFYEGERGMREAYEDTLTATDTIRAYANIEEMHKGLPDFFPEYYKRRTKASIHIRAIIPQNRLSKLRVEKNKEEMRTTRFLPEASMTFSPEINIYNNKILFVSWKEMLAIIIESKELADFHRLTYDLLWGTLKI